MVCFCFLSHFLFFCLNFCVFYALFCHTHLSVRLIQLFVLCFSSVYFFLWGFALAATPPLSTLLFHMSLVSYVHFLSFLVYFVFFTFCVV